MKPRALLVLFLLTGCGIFGRGAKPQLYSLEAVPVTVAPPNVAGAPIGVDGIELPPGLDRRELVVRNADNKLETRGAQWASPLEEMVIHTLAFDLAHRLPVGRVILPGQAKPTGMRALYVTFEDLAVGADSVFVLDARWTLIEPGRPDRAGRERITVPATSLDPPQIVATMSQALAQFADRVVAGL